MSVPKGIYFHCDHCDFEDFINIADLKTGEASPPASQCVYCEGEFCTAHIENHGGCYGKSDINEIEER